MFITLEGIEGSGKTTQIEAIACFLRENGHDVVTTREPGATSTGKKYVLFFLILKTQLFHHFVNLCFMVRIVPNTFKRLYCLH